MEIAKTRQQIADEYGISRKTLSRWLKKADIDLEGYLISPKGQTILGEGGINLSGGQQQIVALARALYRKPQLLLLDEPTSALDRNTEAFVLNLLQQLKHDTAILVTTHRLKTARCADRIYLIENGSTHLHGNHQELLLTENLYSQAWNDLYEMRDVKFEV